MENPFGYVEDWKSNQFLGAIDGRSRFNYSCRTFGWIWRATIYWILGFERFVANEILIKRQNCIIHFEHVRRQTYERNRINEIAPSPIPRIKNQISGIFNGIIAHFSFSIWIIQSAVVACVVCAHANEDNKRKKKSVHLMSNRWAMQMEDRIRIIRCHSFCILYLRMDFSAFHLLKMATSRTWNDYRPIWKWQN